MVILLVSINPDVYSSKMKNILLKADDAGEKILYVSLNKTHSLLIKEIKNLEISLDKFIFIDTITASVMEPKSVDNCVFLSNAKDMRKIYSSIIKLIKDKDIDLVLFDSLSSLTTYKNVSEINHFLKNLINSLKLLNCSMILTCLNTEHGNPLIQRVKMITDKTLNLN